MTAGFGGSLDLSSNDSVTEVTSSHISLKDDHIEISSGGKLDVKSNADINIKGGADLNVESTGNINIASGADLNVQSGGDLNIASGGKVNVQSGGDIDVASGGDINVQSGGKIDVASGGDVDIEGGGQITVKSAGKIEIASQGALDVKSGGGVTIAASANLLPDSERDRTTTRFLSIPVGEILRPYVGQTISVSFEIKGTTARNFIVYAYQASGVSINETHTFTMPTSSFTRYSFQTTVKDYGEVVQGQTGAIAFYDSTGSQSYTVRKIQIELGDTATAWVAAAGMTMNSNGISMQSGKLDFQADSEINFESGGKFNVFATDDDSVIKFGGTTQNPNFSLGAGGTVKAAKVITDELEVTGNNGVPMFAMNDSIATQMIVSATQPTGHGILWVQPTGSSGTVEYTASPGGTDMTNWDASQTFTANIQGTALSGSTCTYGVKFSIYNYQSPCYIDSVTVSVGGVTTPIYSHTYDHSSDVKFLRVGDTLEVNTLNAPSAPLSYAGSSTLSVTVSITKSDAGYNPISAGAQFAPGQNLVVRCNGNGSATTQACGIFYIP